MDYEYGEVLGSEVVRYRGELYPKISQPRIRVRIITVHDEIDIVDYVTSLTQEPTSRTILIPASSGVEDPRQYRIEINRLDS